MSTPADPYRDWDVAYVLGSLSPAERREFEHHLGECPACAGCVGALAGIPGILSSVPHERAIQMMEQAGPATAPARPGRTTQQSRRWARFRFTAVLIGTAAAGVVVGMALHPEAHQQPRE